MTDSNPPEAPFSINLKPGQPPQVTFRPEGDVVDWCPSLLEIRDSGIFDEIAKTQQAMDAAFLVVTQLGGQRVDAPAAGGDGRSCAHGVMKYATGDGKNGKPYHRYDCPIKAAGCAAQWGKN